MRILFDQGTPVPLRRALAKHEVATAYEMGWAQLEIEAAVDSLRPGHLLEMRWNQ